MSNNISRFWSIWGFVLLFLDDVDRKILRYLQKEGRISNQALATKISLSPAPCLRRVRRLEELGLICGYHARLSQKLLGYTLTAFVHVSLNDHQASSIQAFDRFIETAEEVIEGYSVSGEHDFLLKVVAKDMDAIERFLIHDLMSLNIVRSTNTTFVLRERKRSVLPVS